MKVISDSKVELVGHTTFVEHSEYDVPADGVEIERLGAFAAKGCYDSYGIDGRACVENQQEVIEHLHGSVLEHSTATIFIEGVTRALSLELNRHRPFAISQRSTRFTKEEDSAIVLEPYYAEVWNKYDLYWNDSVDAICTTREGGRLASMVWDLKSNPELELVIDFINAAYDSVFCYGEQVEGLIAMNPLQLEGFGLRKWARGKARNILPHALETRGTYTANFRAWRWFIEVRSSRHAEPEIRRLAEKVYAVLKPLAPVYFADFQLKEIVDGIPEYAPKHHKV